ncbi:TPA: cell division topological specificity factor MinE [Candidatus Poribacteria bacterium]|nr:cell division topological specificity factor MinE [Candidatus Poribacteria bacterium]
MFDRIINLIRKQPKSKTVAKNRLKLILIQDRTLVEPDILEGIRDELVDVLSKYFEFEQSSVEMELHRENESLAFIASVPVTSMKIRHRVGESARTDVVS